MDKMIMSWQEMNALASNLVREITLSGFAPDYIVGINRGGLTLATMVSHYFKIPSYSLTVRLRNTVADVEHNAWMPEDAFGDGINAPLGSGKNILIVDDINDSGATFEWIKKDWSGADFGDKDPHWDNVWHNNVRFAVLVDNEASDQKVDFRALAINKAEKDVWVVFPWENWWEGK